ncbi:MAG: TlpA family protein disulfide reductase [Chitinophagales bacterium]|nr:TlpA family protein disulfide reductase [Chitinophagales bacterium]
MKYRNLIIAGIVLACIAFIGYYFYDYYKIPDSPEGNYVTDIVYPDVNGNPLPLSSLKGNIVLIDFWAGWCGPCRYLSPQLVSLYKQYHRAKFRSAIGFEIYSVSLDVNRDYWLHAIEQDGLIWKSHVSDLRGWSSDAAERFGIRSIPASILVDENGKIIGKNLTPAEIEDKLKARLSQ